MILYADASAILATLLDEEDAPRVQDALDGARLVIASELTLVECDRSVHRAVALGRMEQDEASERRERLEALAASWLVLALDAAITRRARSRFPVEPLRTLDALHLATALVAERSAPGLQMLALDMRLRSAAESLGLGVQPRPRTGPRKGGL